MKKNELKNGMIVEYRCGDKRLVVNDHLIGDNGSAVLSVFNDDLKYKDSGVIDIIKVYKYKYNRSFNRLLEDDNLDLIWERKENKLTDKEIEILKALKVLGFKYLARDENAYLNAYNDKPNKGSYDWSLIIGQFIDVIKDIFDFIKWEDKEPTSIDDLLEIGENDNEY